MCPGHRTTEFFYTGCTVHLAIGRHRLSEPSNYHMTSQQFREYGYAMIDWISHYYESVESFPVLSKIEPGAVRRALPSSPPQQPESFEAILRDVEQIVLPGITHWQSPNFFAYFPANTSGPAILGDLLSSGSGRAGHAMGHQSCLHRTGDSCARLAGDAHGTYREKFLSTSTGGGVIQDTASVRHSVPCLPPASGPPITRATARAGRSLVAYTSTQAHSSIEKAARSPALAATTSA